MCEGRHWPFTPNLGKNRLSRMVTSIRSASGVRRLRFEVEQGLARAFEPHDNLKGLARGEHVRTNLKFVDAAEKIALVDPHKPRYPGRGDMLPQRPRLFLP